ncbi:DUF397 domain-containing protein [Actinomadura atramentaria]|uniref:DUF397 domain-containing protein n=1 Tax=Actinomadura atramentaria TaxID=1990 RepID=UPI0009FF035E|nr:DUF397 domain-containing protein [Actinomadura atramentaria]
MIRRSSRGITAADLPAVHWRKSSHSSHNGECVEAATLDGTHLARDSKNPTGAVLAFSQDAWAAFLGQVKAGNLDLS